MNDAATYKQLLDKLAPASQATARIVNPVHERLRRLEASFRPAYDASATANDECLAAIKRFLNIIDWSEGERRIFESLPHADTLETLQAFRSMLFRLGFNTSMEKASAKTIRDEFLPCFLRTPSGRLVLIEKMHDADNAVVYDSAKDLHFTFPVEKLAGVAVFPETMEKRAEQNPAAAPKWSTTAFKAFKPVIVRILLISFIVNIFALAPPIYVMNVYDKAVGAKSLDVLFGLTFGILLIVAAHFALLRIRVRLQAYFGARLDEQLNETAFRHLLHLPLPFTEDAPIGSQLTRLRQMTALHEAFTGPLAAAIFDLPYIILFIAVIAVIGGHLVWVPVSLIAAYVIVAAWAAPHTSQLVRAAGDSRAQLNNLTVEAVSAQRAIKDLAAEFVWLRRHRRLSAEAAIANMKARQFNFLLQTFSQSLVALAGVATLAIGATLVIEGELSGGALIAVMALSWRVLGPIRNLFLCSMTIGQTLQSIEQINRLVRMPLEREPNAGPSIPRTFKGHVIFDKVSFKYAGQREPALRAVSFDVKPGELLCLYGHSGAGTSTVLRMLLGLYQQQAGSIFIDGLDLRQLDKGEWRHSLGVAMPAFDLFHGTIAQNIRLAHPTATDDEIMDIIRRFGVDSYFDTILEDGLETRYTTMARTAWPDALLSRLSLCRAFVKKVPIYLLDEPASTLDNGGEEALLSLINERRQDSAIIMTTQRPSHMRIADKIVWMHRGAVQDIGPAEKIVPKLMTPEAAVANGGGRRAAT